MKKIQRILRAFAILLIPMLFLFQDALAQCAMCRATVENNVSSGETSVAAGLNMGILYLFVTPYLVIGVVAFLWYKKSKANVRKNRLASRFRNKMSEM